MIGMIRGYRPISRLVLLAIVVGLFFSSDLQADARYKMVNDYRLYTYSEYRAKRQYDQTLLIRVTDDRRARTEGEPQGGSIRATKRSRLFIGISARRIFWSPMRERDWKGWHGFIDSIV